ncbi:ParB/Srx family N-terminal domain-containing protein [Myroides injenensis]|uniref:ParB/Srx family N-terminal domain-containing protein n=1 Tax=Myroides injenensis TaxID=1183151 RepID=UPI000288357D|nr:ParB/Srx family N-terminal domain-containing protein [Myroides injenensis]
MKYYWKDLQNDNDLFTGIELHIEQATTASMQLLTGVFGTMKLMVNNQTAFWGVISNDYCEIAVIRTFEEDSRLLPVITSPEIESRKELDKHVALQSWTRYFIEKLINNDKHFFYNGIWHFDVYGDLNQRAYYKTRELEKQDFDALYYADWNRDIMFSRKVDLHSGRLKWWRKKASEGILPPILTWFIPSLGEYWIIDGNYRLQAALLEQTEIPVIVAYSGEYKQAFMNPAFQKGMLQAIDKAYKNINKLSPISFNGLNQQLMHAFDNRPFFQQKTFAKAKIQSPQQWLEEVSNYLNSIDYPTASLVIERLKKEL